MRTFQSRLAAKQNAIAQKLSDNAISWLGTLTDVIRIKLNKNHVGDVNSKIITAIDAVEIMFPPLKDIPMWRFTNNGSVSSQSADIHGEDKQPMVGAAPVSSKVDQGDIIIKFFDNPMSDKPMVLILQIKDVLGTFGQRSIIFQKLNISYYDEQLEPEIWQWCMDAATRRKILKW